MKYLLAEYWQGFFSAVVGWGSSFLLPSGPFILMVTVLTFADLYTGTRAAKKRGEKIVSSGLRRTIEKLFLYSLAILTAEGMKVVFLPMVPMTYITAFAICITEFKSNIENIEAVTGVQIWTFLKDKISLISKSKNDNG